MLVPSFLWLLGHKPAPAKRGEQALLYGQVGERLRSLPGVALAAQRACVRDRKAPSLTKESRDVGRKGEEHEREQSMGRGDVKVAEFLQGAHVEVACLLFI